jgi:hypothetical protein
LLIHSQYVTSLQSNIFDGLSIGLHGQPDVITKITYQGKYYIHFKSAIVGEGRWYTNELGDLPNFTRAWRNDTKIIVPLTSQGYKTVFNGDSILDFIPNRYVIKDRLTGHVNKDVIMDEVMVLESDVVNARILLILKGKVEGYGLEIFSDKVIIPTHEDEELIDAYENMSLEAGRLTISFYGGDIIRWGKKYTYDTYHDYKLIEYETTSFNTENQESVKIQYDLVTGQVIRTSGEDQTLYSKVILEDYSLNTFDINEGIDEAYE